MMPEIPKVHERPGRKFIVGVMLIAVVALGLSVYAILTMGSIKPLLLGSKRFDHFTFHNVGPAPVSQVNFKLMKADGSPWGSQNGWDLGTVQNGGTTTWVMNWVVLGVGAAEIDVTVTYDDNGNPVTKTLKIDAPGGADLNSSEVWFGPKMGDSMPGPVELSGHAVVSTGQVVVHE